MSVVLWVVVGLLGLLWVGACVLWVMVAVGVLDPRGMRAVEDERAALEQELDACPDVPFGVDGGRYEPKSSTVPSVQQAPQPEQKGTR